MTPGSRSALMIRILLILICLPILARADEDLKTDELPPVDFHQFFPQMGYNFTRGLFSKDNIVPLYLGAIGAATVGHWDQEISRHIRGNSKFSGNAGNIGGSPVVAAVAAASLFAAPFTKNEKFRSFAFDLSEGYVLNFTMVTILKNTVRRTRPNLRDKVSFPSGHAADSFLLATVLNHYYGKKIGIPAYLLAAFVAYSRIENAKHFPSDVVFGATVGYIAGSTAIAGRRHRTEKKVAFLPLFGGNSAGLDITWR